MKKARYIEEQSAFALKWVEISPELQTLQKNGHPCDHFLQREGKFAGPGVTELRCLLHWKMRISAEAKVLRLVQKCHAVSFLR